MLNPLICVSATRPRRWTAWCLLIGCPSVAADGFASNVALYPDGPPLQHYVQAELGRTSFDAMSRRIEGQPDTASEAVYLFGLVVQQTRDDGDWQYGWEGGARLGFGSDQEWLVRLAGSGSTIKVRTELWTGDLTLGNFVSWRTAPWVRWYASTGPALYWGRANNRDNDDSESTRESGTDTATTTATFINVSSHQDDLGLSWYARAGVEFTPSPNVNLGLSVRKLDARLNLRDLGRVQLDQLTYLFTLGYSY